MYQVFHPIKPSYLIERLSCLIEVFDSIGIKRRLRDETYGDACDTVGDQSVKDEPPPVFAQLPEVEGGEDEGAGVDGVGEGAYHGLPVGGHHFQEVEVADARTPSPAESEDKDQGDGHQGVSAEKDA